MVYFPGDWLVICDRCGFKRYRSQCRKTWDNLIVCKDCYEPRHPQDYMVRAVPDGKAVPDARPRPTDVFGAAASSTDLTPSAPTYGINRLLDGDFDDVTTHWTATNSATIVQSTSAPYFGKYCLQITEGGHNYPYIYQKVTVSPNVRYRITAWCRGGTSTQYILDCYDFTNSATVISFYGVVSTSRWTKLERDFTVPSGCTTLQVDLYINTLAGTGLYLYYDHCSLTTV